MFYLNLGRSYFSANRLFSSGTRESMYFFQPGHHPACQRQMRPKIDLGFRSYVALNLHVSQLCPAMDSSPYVSDKQKVVTVAQRINA